MYPSPDIGGFRGICNGFLVKMVLYCWKYFWWKLQCIPVQALVVVEEYAMDFWSKSYYIVESISAGNCIASLARQWWYWGKMQWISGQNGIVLLEVFLVYIAMHPIPDIGGFRGI